MKLIIVIAHLYITYRHVLYSVYGSVILNNHLCNSSEAPIVQYSILDLQSAYQYSILPDSVVYSL